MAHIVEGKQAQKEPEMIEITKESKYLTPLLHELLCRASPYGTEQNIIDLFPFKNEGQIDAAGNFIIKIGENPQTMFSCHMDTVHSIPEELLKQKKCGRIILLTRDPKKVDPQKTGFIYGAVRRIVKGVHKETGEAFETKSYVGLPLGADDKIGVYTMCRMIENKIPGLYVFHVGEEIGSPGSIYISTKTPELVKDIKRCIAFDRRGYGDVIEFQRGGACASKSFTHTIAERMNKLIRGAKVGTDYYWKGSVHGTFTDSANYTHLVPECTNLSVGYFNQHGAGEHFDWLWYSVWFLPAVLEMAWDTLPVVRTPVKRYEASNYDYSTAYRNNITYAGNGIKKIPFSEITRNTVIYELPEWKIEDGFIAECSLDGMTRLVERWMQTNYLKTPSAIADLLMQIAELEQDVDIAEDKLSAAQHKLKKTKSLEGIIDEVFVKNLTTKRRLVKQLHKHLQFCSIGPMFQKTLVPQQRRMKNYEERLHKLKPCTPEIYFGYNEIMIKLLECTAELSVSSMPKDINIPPLSDVKREAFIFILENSSEEYFKDFKTEKKTEDVVKEPVKELAVSATV